ncbi:MAG: tRNA pseudouridine(13) synthase TruD, partial [Xenococcus sp. (in: cyanobacteria)]
MEIPVLKKNVDDFLVNESFLLPRLVNLKKSIFCYYWLRKCGFTTFEAVEKLANYLNVSQDCIQYAGLKDEDGITEQLIAIRPIVFSKQLKQFNKDNEYSPNKFIVLSFYGYGNEAINIGHLNGNAFRLVVRNLSENFFDKFKAFKKNFFYFVNYYDTQRFGISSGSKNTHLVGKELLNNDNKAALEVLKQLGTPESIK